MKVISWNTSMVQGFDEVVDVGRIVRVARDLADFDAICLQEVAVNYPKPAGVARPPISPPNWQGTYPAFKCLFVPAIDEFFPMAHRAGSLAT